MKKLFLVFFILLFAYPCFGASSRVLPTSYNESTYGDATRDYTSLATWEAATDTNLVTATAGEVLTCYDDSTTYDDRVTMAGATTSSAYFRVIRAVSGSRGTPTVGVRFEKLNNTVNTTPFIISEDYSSTQDIAVKSTTVTDGVVCNGIISSSNYTKILGCTVYDVTGTNIRACGIVFYGGATENVVANCFIDNTYGGDSNKTANIRFSVTAGTKTFYLYNNTITNCNYYGVEFNTVGGTTVCNTKNCVVQGNGTNIGALGSGALTHSQTTNVTSGVTFAADDYHLASTDTGAIDNGTDLSSDGTFAFDDDIDGDTRTGDWDVGCDEYEAEAGVTGHGMGMFFSY